MEEEKAKKMELEINHISEMLKLMPETHGPFIITCKQCGGQEIDRSALDRILKIHEELLESRRAISDQMIYGTGYRFLDGKIIGHDDC